MDVVVLVVVAVVVVVVVVTIKTFSQVFAETIQRLQRTEILKKHHDYEVNTVDIMKHQSTTAHLSLEALSSSTASR